WKPSPAQAISVTAAVRNGDLADALALAGQPSAGYSGLLSADARATGTIGNPIGRAGLLVTNGTLQDEPFDRLEAQIRMSDQHLEIPSAYIVAGSARINLGADFQHPRESLSTGRLHAHLQSNNINLAQFRTIQKARPKTSGELQMEADASGTISGQK